ncbi:MAG: ComEC/Rec2 family competence protein, partial [Patescibacteria group bacterium]
AFLPRAARLAGGALAIILFAVMTGGSATIVRASLMAILVVVARATGRIYGITRALLLAGFLMVLHNPKILVFDTSFQLSFLSTLGLIYLSPVIEKWLGFIPEKLQLRQIAAATIATQIFVLPLLLYQMGQLSIVSLPVNLLILPAIPWTMLFGFLAGALGFISQIIALPFAFIAYLLLAFQLKIVALFAALPFASIAIPYFPAAALFGCYVVFALLKFFSTTSQFKLTKKSSM